MREAFTVVGVVGAVKQAGLTDHGGPRRGLLSLRPPRATTTLFVVVRTSLPPESLGRRCRNVVRQVDPELPVNDVRSMETRIADSLVAPARRRCWQRSFP